MCLAKYHATSKSLISRARPFVKIPQITFASAIIIINYFTVWSALATVGFLCIKYFSVCAFTMTASRSVQYRNLIFYHFIWYLYPSYPTFIQTNTYWVAATLKYDLQMGHLDAFYCKFLFLFFKSMQYDSVAILVWEPTLRSVRNCSSNGHNYYHGSSVVLNILGPP